MIYNTPSIYLVTIPFLRRKQITQSTYEPFLSSFILVVISEKERETEMAPGTRKPLGRRDRNIPNDVHEGNNHKTDVSKKETIKTVEIESKLTVTSKSKTGDLNKVGSTHPESVTNQKIEAVPTATEIPETVKVTDSPQNVKDSSEVDSLANLLSKTHIDATGPVLAIPPPPARPQTAYQAFAADAWAAAKATEGPTSLKQMSTLVAEKWRNAPQQVKTTYEERTREARQHYEDAKREHTDRLAVMEEERAALEFMRKKELQEEAMAFFLKHRGNINQTIEPKKDERVKPKAPRSAYNFFVTRRREEMISKGEKPSVGEVAGTIAEEWKKIQSSRKKKDKQSIAECQALASEDQARYLKELDEYKQWVEENEKKKVAENEEYRKRALEAYRSEMQDKEDAKAYRKLMAKKAIQEREDRKAARVAKTAEKAAKELEPKRARNAYMFFFAEKSKDEQVRQQAEKEEKSIATVVSEMWKQCEEEEKGRFQDMATKDKLRFAKEVVCKEGRSKEGNIQSAGK